MITGKHLQITEKAKATAPRMILGFTGWMDGGEVSTGTVTYFVNQLKAVKFANILPSAFYIYNFPGPMELSAVFRPYVKMAEGLIQDYEEPSNLFYYDEKHDLIFFVGKEPHVKWAEYIDSLFSIYISSF